jgi:hypothetical protein
MNVLLLDIAPDNIFIYLDDILIAAHDVEENVMITSKILQCLIANKLYGRLNKCEFFKNTIGFLGFVISKNTVIPNSKSLNNIDSYAAPRTVRQLQQFLGMTNYLKQFVHSYSELTKPLTKLLKKDVSDKQPKGRIN